MTPWPRPTPNTWCGPSCGRGRASTSPPAASPTCPWASFRCRLEDLELTGPGAYGYAPLVEALAAHVGWPRKCRGPRRGTSFANHLALAGAGGPATRYSSSPGLQPDGGRRPLPRGEVTEFPRRAEDGYALDPGEIAGAALARTRVIVITNLHNPTSVHAGEEALRAVGAIARDVGRKVLVDEVYREAAVRQHPPLRVPPRPGVRRDQQPDQGLRAQRPAVRLDPGRARARPRLWRLNDLFGVNAPHAVERLAVIALDHLPAVAARAKALLETNRALMNAFLESRTDLDSNRVEQGMTAFPRLKRGNVDDLCSLLRQRYETTVVPGRFFEMPDHFRVAIGCPTETLREGLARLAAALDEAG